jgi:hypothetical protein
MTLAGDERSRQELADLVLECREESKVMERKKECN